MSKNKQKNFTDPADEVDKEAQGAEDEKQLAFSASDFTAIPVGAAKTTGPFEGYPEKKGFVSNEFGDQLEINFTHLVMYADFKNVPQDPSGTGRIVFSKKEGRDVRQNIPTSHSRCILNADGDNVEVVFDRTFFFKDGTEAGGLAVVPDFFVRSQLGFYYDSLAGKRKVATAYRFIDKGQISRLRRAYEIFTNPNIAIEKEADLISNEDV